MKLSLLAASTATALFAIVGLTGWNTPVPATSIEPTSTISVNPAMQYQTVEGWGTSLAWFAHVLGRKSDPHRHRIVQLLFSKAKGLGLNVVRYNIGGGENPKYHFMQTRAQIPGYEPRPGTWNWTADKSQRRILLSAIKAGADQLEAFSNSPPYWMTVSGSVTGSINGYSNNIAPQNYRPFAHYLARVSEHFAKVWGITFRTLEPFNEPLSTWWKFGGAQEGSHIGTVAQRAIVQDLQTQLKKTAVLTQIASPDDNSINQTVENWLSYPTSIRLDVSQINTHSYNGIDRNVLFNLSKKAGTDLWMSEYGDGDATGLTMSEQILRDMKLMHPNAWVYWQGVDDSTAPGWGLLTSNLNRETTYGFHVNEKYYVMGNYSKFIRPGYILVAANNTQSLAAYNPNTSTLAIVQTNDTFHPTSLRYRLGPFSHLNQSAQVYETSHFQGIKNLQRMPSIPIVHKALLVTSPPFSVNTYVIHGAYYQPPIKTIPHTSFHSTVPTHTFRIAFSGIGVRVFGNLGPDSGMATFHVVGQTSETLDLYESESKHNVLLYASPTVPNGTHQIVITVTGLKNYYSHGTGVTISHIASVRKP